MWQPVRKYNGKPVEFVDGDGDCFVDVRAGSRYLEVDVDLRDQFSKAARAGVAWGMAMAELLDGGVAFVLAVFVVVLFRGFLSFVLAVS